VGTARDAIEPRGDQDRAELPAAGERRLETRAPVVLARGDVLVLGDQCPALARDEALGGGALRLQPEAALALLGGRHPQVPDREPLFGPPQQPASAVR